MAFPVTLNGRTYTLTDFEGTNYVDGLPDAFEDFVTHAGDIYNSTSTTSNSIGTGSKTFTVEANKPYQAGTPLRIADAAAPSTNFLDTVVTSYSGTTLVVNSIGYGGSGTKTSWTVNIGGAKTVDGTLGLSQGGTGATTAAAARTNIDVYSKSETDTRYLNISGDSADISFGANMSFGDNNKAIFGAGSDLQIYSDGTKSYLIESGSGDLELRATDFVVKNAGNTKIMASFNDGGTVQLRYDNEVKLATSSTGVDVTGNATFADNGKAIFGAGSDLQIYHDGATSRIEDINGGNLILRSSADVRIDKYTGENMGVFNADGSVDLYYDNSKKLATTSTGVNITGTLTSDGLTVDGTATFTTSDNNPQLIIKSTDADANDGPVFDLVRDSASPADNDAIGSIRWRADDSAGNETQYADIRVFTDDVTDGTEDVNFTLRGIRNGTLVSRLAFNSSEMIINDSSNNVDLRVESDNNTHMLFVDAGNNRIGVGTNTGIPDSTFAVKDTKSGDWVTILHNEHATNGFGMKILAGDDSAVDTLRLATYDNNQNIAFKGDGGAIFNDRGQSTADFRVESDGNANMLFVDAGANYVSMGGSGARTNSTLNLHDAGRWTLASGGSSGCLAILGSNGGDGSYSGGISFDNSGSRSGIAGYQSSSDPDVMGISFFTHASGTGSAASTENFRIDAGGNLFGTDTTISSLSDQRLKTNIEDYSFGLEKFKQLQPRQFDWIVAEAHTNDARIGFVSQEVQSVDPAFVYQTHLLGNDYKEQEETLLGGDLPLFSQLDRKDAMYVSVIQDLLSKIETLETRITALENA